MKIYENGSIEMNRVTVDLNELFAREFTQETFKELLLDEWMLRKVFLSTKQIKDLNTTTGTIITIYNTTVSCFELSTFCKLLCLAVSNNRKQKEFIIPYELYQDELFSCDLIHWLDFFETGIYFYNNKCKESFLLSCEAINMKVEVIQA